MLSLLKNTITRSDIESFMADSKTQSDLKKSSLQADDVRDTLLSLAEKSAWDIRTILLGLNQEIEDKPIRYWFRRFLISKKYGILSRQGNGYGDYSVVFANDSCVLVQCPRQYWSMDGDYGKASESTAILSPEGDIRVPEGIVCLFQNTYTWHGFMARWDGKFGLYSPKGNEILPCIFDYVECKDYEIPAHFCYKGLYYFCWHFTYKNILYDKTIASGYSDRDDLYLNNERALSFHWVFRPSYLPRTDKDDLDSKELPALGKQYTEELSEILGKKYNSIKKEERTSEGLTQVLSNYMDVETARELAEELKITII